MMLNNIVFLGCTNGYGYSYSACNTKVEFMARGLSEHGDICYIHNGTGGKSKITAPEYTELDRIGTIVDYPAFGSWHISHFRNQSLLIADLKRWHCDDRKNWVIVEAPYLPYYYMYIRAARKAGYYVAVISHEWLGTYLNSNPLRRMLNHWYSRVFGYSVDAILPISEYIIKRIQLFGKPYLKVPVEADFSTPPKSEEKGTFFLYCVSAEYNRVILTVLEGFREFTSRHPEYKLLLVLSGSPGAIQSVKGSVINMGLDERVEILHKIPYAELQRLNKTASGLIVPLNPEFEQDKARFSQKIAEYLASATTVISNQVGEVKNYFTDRENIILDEYSSRGFTRSFEWIASNGEQAIKIGLNGFELGKKYFDYRLCGEQLHGFLSDEKLF